MPQSRYLVTGGAGFIGSHLVTELIRLGHPVVVLDDFSTGKRENLAHLEGRFELVEGDIRRPDEIRPAMEGVDYVLHQAALPSVPRSVQDPETSFAVNAMGTLNVLEAARKAGVQRVVYAASSSAYGDTEVLPKVETMVPCPRSPYAAAKLSGEHLIQAYNQVFSISCVALRYFNVFGPRQDPTSQYSAVIPRFVTAMLKGEPPIIYGDGGQTRDFSHVQNVVEANLAACRAPNAPGHVINVACGERISLLELVREIGRLLGCGIEPVHQQPRPGDVRHSLADLGRARELLGWTPSLPIREGLAQVVDWYRSRAT